MVPYIKQSQEPELGVSANLQFRKDYQWVIVKQLLIMMNADGLLKKLLISTVIVVLSMATGLLFNVVNPNGIKVFGGSTVGKAVSLTTGDHADAEVPEDDDAVEYISLEDAKVYFDKGDALFVDARSRKTYASRHIQGAVSLPAASFDKRFDEFSNDVDKEATLVVYCQSSTCPKSDVVAEKLEVIGYTAIKIFAGGWVEWVEAGYPVEGE